MLVAEIKISYEPEVDYSKATKITNSKDVSDVFRASWNEKQIAMRECFKIMLLNNSNKVLGICEISQGGITATVADSRLIFGTALKAMATRIILAHNHPSGKMEASDSDISLTKKIAEGGKILDIALLDHIILSPYNDDYFSFADEGII